MIEQHRIRPEHFAALSRGLGGAAAVAELRDSQLSRHLLLMRYLVDAWPGPQHDRDHAVAVLAEAQERDPAAVRALLADPMVGAWAAATVRRLRGAVRVCDPLEADLGHLSALAAVAAARTGVDADLIIRRVRGLVILPTLGAARMGGELDEPVAALVRAGTLKLRDGASTMDVNGPAADADPQWWPLWRLCTSDGGARVVVDDVNPYREAYGIPVAARLGADDVESWREHFDGAWSLLIRHVPARALELASGLRTLVPLLPDSLGAARSVTNRNAFGALGLTSPASPVELAIAMVHEFQHSKLNAILDLVDLYDRGDPATYFAPWRLDPRPVGGLYQGVYAFLGVADVMGRLCGDPALRESAELQFAITREQVRCGLETLLGAPSLTGQGRRFADGIRRALDQLYAMDVPQGICREAERALDENRSAWRARTGRTA